jgi:hypothetical protein
MDASVTSVSAPRATCRRVTLGMMKMWYAKMIFIKQQRLLKTRNIMNKCIQSFYLDGKERTKCSIPMKKSQ